MSIPSPLRGAFKGLYLLPFQFFLDEMCDLMPNDEGDAYLYVCGPRVNIDILVFLCAVTQKASTDYMFICIFLLWSTLFFCTSQHFTVP